MEEVTHTVIECDLDFSQVEDMLYTKYLSQIQEYADEGVGEEIARILGSKSISVDPPTKASKWVEEVMRELSIPWKLRLLHDVNKYLEDKYVNPYDKEGTWNHNPILSKILYHIGQDNWDVVISQCMKGLKKMGAAFPINLTEDRWLDIRIIPLSTANKLEN